MRDEVSTDAAGPAASDPNPDGGWGYIPGKQSWLEPSVYASLCLHGEPAAERAWQLISGWQNSDGSWRPAQEVRTSTWATALCVTLAAARRESGHALQAGTKWLLDSEGAESTLTYRLSSQLRGAGLGHSGTRGWSWTAYSVSAVEPTAHTMVALKKASGFAGLPSMGPQALAERLKSGEELLLASKGSAGFVLLGLQERDGMDPSLESARNQLAAEETPALTRTWLRLALRLRGEKLSADPLSVSNDLMKIALEALAHEDGNFALLRSSSGGGRA